MPVQVCQRCKHFNPEYAAYCYFDGVVLQAQQNAAVLRLPSDFTFPSGRRCKTFDELAQGCQEEWAAARDLLMRGTFAHFFTNCNRVDLVRAANDAKAQANPDIGLTTFLTALPGTRTATPKLDLNPRRILLGKVVGGDTKTVPLTITNQGQGMLQGTLTISEGQDWLSLGPKPGLHEIEISTAREQSVKLTITTKGQAAGQSYGARLTVVTNGGVVEVPLRMDLVAQAYAKAPFQGVRSQREMAEKMRSAPKAAVPVLESGDVQRWFELNGWLYPMRGTPIKGVAGVQQFFESMGVSKPPVVQLSKKEIRVTCKYKETARAQVALQTAAKKWVYANLSSDSPWLKLAQAQVSGPQHAAIALEIDTNLWTLGPSGEGTVSVVANGGQKLTLKVVVEVPGAPPATQRSKPPPPPTPAPAARTAPTMPTAAQAPASPVMPLTAGSVKFIPALATTLLVCLALRVLLIPIVDCWGRSSVVAAAAEKLDLAPGRDSPSVGLGGWLHLPWFKILGGADEKFSAKVFDPNNASEVGMSEFRHYFVSYFIRWFVLWTGWIGAIVGAVLVLKRGGGTLDIPWGVIAGTFAGFAGSVTLAACFLLAELLPHALWQFTMGAQGGFGFLLLWSLLALFCWLLIGTGLGVVLPWIGPLRRLLIDPFQALIATLLRSVGMKGLGDYWAPV
ncbi:MAG: hypothetical protein EXR98_13495 [Gemmataceae bacterium]|nr:hypothetical protein [Gemmataceae bacterium]